MDMNPMHIRPASESDVQAIAEIYNDAILNTTATFDTEVKSAEDRLAWLREHGEKHPVLVAETDGRVVGWASLSSWSERCAYETTSEVSVYVDKVHRGKGIGKTLLQHLVEKADELGMHCLLARIVEGNKKSIHLHEIFGFSIVGVMHRVGFKFDRFLDITMMERVR